MSATLPFAEAITARVNTRPIAPPRFAKREYTEGRSARTVRRILAECRYQGFDVDNDLQPGNGRRLTIDVEALNGAEPQFVIDIDEMGEVTLSFWWCVDLTIVDAPILGPFSTRETAHLVEMNWLERHPDSW